MERLSPNHRQHLSGKFNPENKIFTGLHSRPFLRHHNIREIGGSGEIIPAHIADQLLETADDPAEMAVHSGFDPEVNEEVPTTPNEADIMPDNPIALYFRDIARAPLLTQEEEVELAKEIERGNAAKETLCKAREQGLHLSDDQFELLERESQFGDLARRSLIESNLRLVVSVARLYLGRGLPLLDLVQEGNLGLSAAVEKFDYRRGFKFSTYGYWWIRQSVSRAIANQSRTIRIPVHMVQQIGHVRSKFNELEQQLGRDPKVEEIAKAMDMSIEKVQETFQASVNQISLETPVGDGEQTLGDLLSNQNDSVPDDLATDSLLSDYLDDALAELTLREQMVLRMRFGLRNQRVHTLEEIGQLIGVSRERVRQLEAGAIAKLREPNLRLRLAEYLE